MLFRTLILRASALPFVKAFMTRSPLVRPVVRRFIAGETVEQAIQVGDGLAASCFNVSLDLLGENVASVTEAERERDAYVDLVRRIGQSPHVEKINVSIKLTALGLDQGDEIAEKHYREIVAEAAKFGMFVRADMEASAYTERTVAMVARVFADLKNTGTVLQSMLHRTLDDARTMIALGARVRIVKGAYLEPATVAYQDKATVDAKYVEVAKMLLSEGNYPAIATHDERIIGELKAFVREKGIDPAKFEWQMLYGIRRDLQDRLREEGYNVRVYVPFGSAWYPYFSRRLAERPANLAFIAKSLVRR
ncbi:MAG: proline dehydrogenase family protein [Fimbriimonadaceae bacterium]|nr:proline dehydrogenase family protein [Fimbriimonadaceae bacterium]QYK55036.1 MAG: proline dehydrogenase family protein [Fimbriimonadaceae bacterium]